MREENNNRKPEEQQPEKTDASKKIAVNPDPRANENISGHKTSTTTSDAGEEITDGEGG